MNQRKHQTCENMTEQNDEQKGCGTSEKKYVNKNNIEELHTGGTKH